MVPAEFCRLRSISAASAVNAKGAFWFCTYEGALNAAAGSQEKACVREYVVKRTGVSRRRLQKGEKLTDKM
jgi:hypothetical protein